MGMKISKRKICEFSFEYKTTKSEDDDALHTYNSEMVTNNFKVVASDHVCSDLCKNVPEGYIKACFSSDCDVKVFERLENTESKLGELRFEHEKLLKDFSNYRTISQSKLERFLEEFSEYKSMSQDKWINSVEIELSQMVRQFEDAVIRKRAGERLLKELPKNSLLKFSDLKTNSVQARRLKNDPDIVAFTNFINSDLYRSIRNNRNFSCHPYIASTNTETRIIEDLDDMMKNISKLSPHNQKRIRDSDELLKQFNEILTIFRNSNWSQVN